MTDDTTAPVYIVRERDGIPVLMVDSKYPCGWTTWLEGYSTDPEQAKAYYRRRKLEYADSAEHKAASLLKAAKEARRLAECAIEEEQP